MNSKEAAYPGPDLELFSTALAYTKHGAHIFPGYCFGLHTILLRPLSSGNITLKSRNPFDAPVIDPKYVVHS
jgi:choline dehydrogenase